MIPLILYIFLLFLPSETLSDNSAQETDIDPMDMLNFHSNFEHTEPNVVDQHKLDACDEEHWHLNREIENLKKDNENCNEKIKILNRQLKDNDEKTKMMIESVGKSNNIDFNTFYYRLLKVFYHHLSMNEEKSLLNDSDTAVTFLEVHLSKVHIKEFENIIENKGNPKYDEVDEFFSANIKKVTYDDVYKEDFFTKAIKFVNSITKVEVWIYILSTTIIALMLWVMILFLIDVQRNFKWKSVIFMMMFIIFIISCLWQWKVMVNNAEAKRMSMSKNEKTDSHCEQSIWQIYVTNYLQGYDSCEKHHSNILTSAAEEITPMMAISETVVLTFIQPLNLFGEHFGLFFQNFFQKISFLYVIPASICFIIIFTILAFTLCGYGIELPFFLGSIKPVMVSDNKADAKKLVNEEMQNFFKDRETLLLETRNMLTCISESAISQAKHMQFYQPLMNNTVNMIEKQLENIVSKKFSHYLENASTKNLSITNGTVRLIEEDKVDCTKFEPNDVRPLKCLTDEEFALQVKSILEDSITSDISSPDRKSDKSNLLTEMERIANDS